MPDFRIEDHNHDGINTRKLKPINLEGFPILTSVPTYNALEGTQVIVNDGSVSLYVMVSGTWTQIGGGGGANSYAFGSDGATATNIYLKLAGGVQCTDSVGYYIPPGGKTIVGIEGAWNTDLTSGNLLLRLGGNTFSTQAISGFAISESGLSIAVGEGTLQIKTDSLSSSITSPSIIIFIE